MPEDDENYVYSEEEIQAYDRLQREIDLALIRIGAVKPGGKLWPERVFPERRLVPLPEPEYSQRYPLSAKHRDDQGENDEQE